ncbi:hypothetical protein QF034_005139 [Streptomyces africanus]|uniref:Uncharacterized protein n=1 Tax=Streptomyces africanus TaxID=231024 RepID=A0ABU0QU22_9ACTN|nr:hypothetical protein [Streptomyces africanus]MDQ0750908.1 hypothetical protein [Streptomyces africanus]
MTTTNTPPQPRRDTGAPGETDPFSPRAARGRHRKPRHRKALLTAGGLALAAGALSLVRLASGPGTDSVGTVEAEPRPDPVTTGTDETADTAATVPEASPSSPTALGGLPPSPGTHRPAAASPTPSPFTSTSVSVDTRGADTAATPRSTPLPGATNPPAPTARGEAPRPAPTPPAPPSRAAPAPAPEPEKPKKPQDPDLCVPVIGVCVDPQD